MDQYEDTGRDLKLKKIFSQDGSRLMDSLGRAIKKITKGRVTSETVNQTFRYIHSIKSEAAFLRYNEIKETASTLEDLLGTMRRDPATIRPELIETLADGFADLEREFFNITDQINMELDSLNEDFAGPENITDESEPQFSELEKNLIDEAVERGETLYEVFCEIDVAEPMQYPRLYLIVNNLEMAVNVLKTTPEIEALQSSDKNWIRIYCTTDIPPEEIEDIIDVDQIKSVRVVKIDWVSKGLQLEEEESPHAGERASFWENRKISEFDEYSQGSLFLYMLKRQIEAIIAENSQYPDSVNVIFRKSRLTAMHDLLASMEIGGRLFPTIKFSEIFAGLTGFARDLADTLDKRVRLVFSGGELEIAAKNGDIIAAALKHLVRNAVDHGIETSAMRSESGKSETGSISISVERENGDLIVTVGDDGSGIDWDGDNGELLTRIIEPGYSTKESTTDISGRGVGLDIVRNNVEYRLGGTLMLANTPGEGCTFSFRVTDDPVFDFFLVEAGGGKYAVPLVSGLNLVDFDTGSIVFGDDGNALYRTVEGESPVFSVSGGLTPESVGRIYEKALFHRHGSIPIVFVFDNYVGDVESRIEEKSEGSVIVIEDGEEVPVVLPGGLMKI